MKTVKLVQDHDIIEQNINYNTQYYYLRVLNKKLIFNIFKLGMNIKMYTFIDLK